MSQHHIVSVDVQIRRTSQAEGSGWLKLGRDNTEKFGEMWILHTYISRYDKQQQLISVRALDTTFSIGKSYTDTLNKAYQRALRTIAATFSDIDYFKPEYFSFCDFQQTCHLLQIQSDTAAHKDYLVYEGKKYQPVIVQDTSYYGFGRSPYHPETLAGLYINSIRVFSTKRIKLVVAHVATGDDISMGLITSDPKNVGKTEDGEITLAREHKPPMSFTDIKNVGYAEPVLHHGYGFDIFIVK